MKKNLLPLLWLGIAFSTQAATYPVDDRASSVLNPSINMKWEEFGPSAGSSTVKGQLGVIVRLDVAQWKGKVGQIYMKLPAQTSAPVLVQWTSRGRLLPGQFISGDRALVYSGLIDQDMLEDTFLINLETDGNRLYKTETLNFSFEIDL